MNNLIRVDFINKKRLDKQSFDELLNKIRTLGNGFMTDIQVMQEMIDRIPNLNGIQKTQVDTWVKLLANRYPFMSMIFHNYPHV